MVNILIGNDPVHCIRGNNAIDAQTCTHGLQILHRLAQLGQRRLNHLRVADTVLHIEIISGRILALFNALIGKADQRSGLLVLIGRNDSAEQYGQHPQQNSCCKPDHKKALESVPDIQHGYYNFGFFLLVHL